MSKDNKDSKKKAGLLEVPQEKKAGFLEVPGERLSTAEKRGKFANNRSISARALADRKITIKDGEELSEKEMAAIAKRAEILDEMRHGKERRITVTVVDVDARHKANLAEILERTRKEYKGDDALKFAKKAEKVIAKMQKRGELDVIIPEGLEPTLKRYLTDFIDASYEAKFINHKGRTAKAGVFEDRPAQLSQIAVANFDSAVQSVRDGQGIAGECPLINNLDILQQSYILGAHESLEIATDRKKYMNRIGQLAEAVLAEFQDRFGDQEGKALAEAVWQQYPFAILDSGPAEALVKDIKVEKGDTPEKVLERNERILRDFSLDNLLPLHSMLQTPGMAVGFLHRNEQMHTDKGTETKKEAIRDLRQVAELSRCVEQLISNNGRVPEVEQAEEKEIHGKHSERAVKGQSSGQNQTHGYCKL